MRTATMLFTIAVTAMGLAAAPEKQRAAKPGGHQEVLPFIADDYPSALSRARALKVPLVVETWAPW